MSVCNLFDHTVPSRLRVVVVWSEQEKWGVYFFAILGVVGGGSATIIYTLSSEFALPLCMYTLCHFSAKQLWAGALLCLLYWALDLSPKSKSTKTFW